MNRAELLSVRSGDEGFLWYSQNFGETWKKSLTLPCRCSIQFAFDKVSPSLAYAAAGNSLYRSFNGGKTFRFISKIRPDDSSFSAASLETDRFTGGKIYVGHHNSEIYWGIFVSEDRGATFSYLPFRESVMVRAEDEPVTHNRIMWDIEQDRNNPDILYVTSEDGSHKTYTGGPHSDPFYIMRTLDGGRRWENISDLLPWHSVMIRQIFDREGGAEWLAGTEGRGLYRLDEVRRQWVVLNQSLGVSMDLMDAGDDIFASSFFKVQRSRDDGATWQTFFQGTTTHQYGGLEFDALGNLYIADYKTGIWKKNVYSEAP